MLSKRVSVQVTKQWADFGLGVLMGRTAASLGIDRESVMESGY
jgi:hypothetical protein